MKKSALTIRYENAPPDDPETLIKFLTGLSVEALVDELMQSGPLAPTASLQDDQLFPAATVCSY